MAKWITPTDGKPNTKGNPVKESPFQVGKSGADWYPSDRGSGPGFIGDGKKTSTGKGDKKK